MTRTRSLLPEAGAVSCHVAGTADELAEHHRIRHAVFVTEQQIFPDSDIDAHDTEPGVRHVLGLAGKVAAGAVRLFPLDGGVWQGDRLAVLPAFRASGLGGPLVRFAVATAATLGGESMIAHIQPPNERFFLRLGWSRSGPEEIYAGLPHVPMEIPLAGSCHERRR
ncbi:MAG: GNAT family N-acetyltransferase [Actinobacteria bacterium]|nr:GNAT family N-acetyltransferase [Actinomycetota bacterium]